MSANGHHSRSVSPTKSEESEEKVNLSMMSVEAQQRYLMANEAEKAEKRRAKAAEKESLSQTSLSEPNHQSTEIDPVTSELGSQLTGSASHVEIQPEPKNLRHKMTEQEEIEAHEENGRLRAYLSDALVEQEHLKRAARVLAKREKAANLEIAQARQEAINAQKANDLLQAQLLSTGNTCPPVHMGQQLGPDRTDQRSSSIPQPRPAVTFVNKSVHFGGSESAFSAPQPSQSVPAFASSERQAPRQPPPPVQRHIPDKVPTADTKGHSQMPPEGSRAPRVYENQQGLPDVQPGPFRHPLDSTVKEPLMTAADHSRLCNLEQVLTNADREAAELRAYLAYAQSVNDHLQRRLAPSRTDEGQPTRLHATMNPRLHETMVNSQLPPYVVPRGAVIPNGMPADHLQRNLYKNVHAAMTTQVVDTAIKALDTANQVPRQQAQLNVLSQLASGAVASRGRSDNFSYDDYELQHQPNRLLNPKPQFVDDYEGSGTDEDEMASDSDRKAGNLHSNAQPPRSTHFVGGQQIPVQRQATGQATAVDSVPSQLGTDHVAKRHVTGVAAAVDNYPSQLGTARGARNQVIVPVAAVDRDPSQLGIGNEQSTQRQITDFSAVDGYIPKHLRPHTRYLNREFPDGIYRPHPRPPPDLNAPRPRQAPVPARWAGPGRDPNKPLSNDPTVPRNPGYTMMPPDQSYESFDGDEVRHHPPFYNAQNPAPPDGPWAWTNPSNVNSNQRSDRESRPPNDEQRPADPPRPSREERRPTTDPDDSSDGDSEPQREEHRSRSHYPPRAASSRPSHHESRHPDPPRRSREGCRQPPDDYDPSDDDNGPNDDYRSHGRYPQHSNRRDRNGGPPGGGPPDGDPPGGPTGSNGPQPPTFNGPRTPEHYDPHTFMDQMSNMCTSLFTRLDKQEQRKLEHEKVPPIFRNATCPSYDPVKDNADDWVVQFELYSASLH